MPSARRKICSLSLCEKAPHICELFDVGSQDGTDFLVMEFLDSETLVEWLRKDAMPVNELLKTGMELPEWS
jgi:serine/threonine protein kinase